MVAPARPSTRTSKVCPTSPSASNSEAVSCPLVSRRGCSGKLPGWNAGWPSAVPDKASEVSCSAGL